MASPRRGERILVAPNAFKGSLSAARAAAAMARGVLRSRPRAKVELLPVSDGGDGLIEVLRGAEGGELVACPVHGPSGEKRRAAYLWQPKARTAVIEMARASGLALVAPAERRVMTATSRGTGDLVKDAVRRGARTVVVGMGGAASNDGGAGLARALGARLLDAAGRELPDGAEALLRLDRVEDKAVRALLAGVKVVALADVSNPLLGPRGSARTFGPQKGATEAQVRSLERALTRWALVLARDLGTGTGRVPGAGAAGGLGAGLLAFCRARLVPGSDWVLDRVGADRALKRADLVLTGEGRFDRTSLAGKAPVALARRSRAPVVMVAGAAERGVKGPFRRVVTFGAESAADSMKRAAFWVAKAAALAVACALFALPCRADEFAAGDELYFHRNEAGKLDDNIKGIEAALVHGENAAYLWRRCRALVRRGETRKTRAEKLADYAAARADCEKAVALHPGSPDAQFWHGVAMGRWGETKGIMKALFLVKPIKRAMEATLALDPAHGGAHHVLGEILWQLPGFAGGDKRRALAEFEAAVRLSPDYTANHRPLAEAYLHFKRKTDAVRVLKAVEAVERPADPAEYPENLADARALLRELEAAP
ncbi:MAG: glycerate kinase [Elusimicrobiota bacterium]|nr:glycerate kinase [Elusimicrobiota bacterium]